MKFKIKVLDLQYAAKLVKDVADMRSEQAERRGVHIKCSGDLAVFTAFSAEITLQTRLKISGIVDGEALIEASALYSAVSRFKPMNDEGLGTSEVSITLSEKSRKFNLSAKTSYSNGSSVPHRRSIALLDASVFPDFSSLSDKKTQLSLPTDVVIDGISSVTYAASSDQNNLLFTGMLFELKAGILTLACSDGICLAEYSVPVEYTGPDIRTVLSSTLANKISRSFNDGTEFNISVSKSHVYFKTTNLIIGGPVISEDYPVYADVLPVPDKYAVMSKSVVMDNLLNLGYEAALEDDSRIKFSMAEGFASMQCLLSDNTGIQVDEFKGDFSFDSNLKLLALSVKNIGGKEVKMGFIDSLSQIYFYPTEESPSGAVLKCVLVPLNRQ
jgi:DNA polymerase III sliding clamp (beta) subunit (PCNA family)